MKSRCIGEKQQKYGEDNDIHEARVNNYNSDQGKECAWKNNRGE